MELDYCEKFVGALKFRLFCASLPDSTANPDGYHRKTKEPVKIDDAEGEGWEVFSVY